MRERLGTIAKWAWVACVALAAGALIWRSRQDIVEMLHRIPAWMLAASALLTVAAKLLLGENARIAAARSGITLDYATAAKLYNLSQMGKYLPGSIWQFVGRAAAYRSRGASYAQIRDSLVTESLWVIAAAGIVGAVLCGPAALVAIEANLNVMLRWWLFGGAAVATVGVVVLLFWKRTALLRYARSAVPTTRAVLVQAGIWLLLGLAFWVLVRACGMAAGPVFSIGLFAAAYAVGFLVPFAPAGLGIRDGVLTLGLLPYTGAGEALAVTVVARVVYLVVELALVALQEPVLAWQARRSASPP